jgi:glucose-6-phosphate isomerase
MNQALSWDYGDSLIDQKELTPFLNLLKIHNNFIQKELNKKYHSPYGFLHLPADEPLRLQIHNLIADKKTHKPTALFIIGIGGSNLGTQAIQQALRGIYYNEVSSPIKCYYMDTLEDLYTQQLLIILEKLLQQGEYPLVVIISKSGTTLETLANTALSLQLLQKYRPHTFTEHLVIITDQGSPLEQSAQEHNIALVSIPPQVGGRFSVLSAVGLFPLALLSFDIDALHNGARKILDNFPHNCYVENAMHMAALIFMHYQAGKNILDTFVYGPSLAALGAWYRQLVGESLGKNGKGMTPTVSVGTTDLHSVVQLYLGGPLDKFTIFLQAHYQKTLIIPSTIFSKNLENPSVALFQNALLQGVQAAYKQRQHPFACFNLNTMTEETLGTFMYMRMLEVIYLGVLMEVNPFDQPHVELYKEQTRKVLKL